jgi:hypothetical protein
MTPTIRPTCSALGCPRAAVITYEAGPVDVPYRTASACRRHRTPVRVWVTDAGRVRRTPIASMSGAAA